MGGGGRPSRGWGRSGTVWLWPFLDASISAVNYGFVSACRSPHAQPDVVASLEALFLLSPLPIGKIKGVGKCK